MICVLEDFKGKEILNSNKFAEQQCMISDANGYSD